MGTVQIGLKIRDWGCGRLFRDCEKIVDCNKERS
jgi:hypothetical protein